MPKPRSVLALDVGSARIGVAQADDAVRIARPLPVIEAGDDCYETISSLAAEQDCDTIVIGYPRNMSGEPTAQSAAIEAFAATLGQHFKGTIVFQDESLTSVAAEQRLANRGRAYTRGAIDSEAACIILTDYIESSHGR